MKSKNFDLTFEVNADIKSLSEAICMRAATQRADSGNSNAGAYSEPMLYVCENAELMRPVWQNATERICSHLSAWAKGIIFSLAGSEITIAMQGNPATVIPAARRLMTALMAAELGLPEPLSDTAQPLDALRSAMYPMP